MKSMNRPHFRIKRILLVVTLLLAMVGVTVIAGNKTDPLLKVIADLESASDQTFIDLKHVETSGELKDRRRELTSPEVLSLVEKMKIAKSAIEAEVQLRAELAVDDAKIAILGDVSSRYLDVQRRLYFNLLKNAHYRIGDEKTYSPSMYDSLNLHINHAAAIFLTQSDDYRLGYNFWHVKDAAGNYDQIEMGLTPGDKDHEEEVILQDRLSDASYSKLILFVSARNRISNQWGIQRVSQEVRVPDPALNSCAENLLSFSHPWSRGSYFEYLQKSDRFEEFDVKLISGLPEVTYDQPLLSAAAFTAVVEKFFHNLPHFDEPNNKLSVIHLMAVSSSTTVDEINKNLAESPARMLNEMELEWKSPKKEKNGKDGNILAITAIINSNYHSDDWSDEAVADRIAWIAFKTRYRGMLDSMLTKLNAMGGTGANVTLTQADYQQMIKAVVDEAVKPIEASWRLSMKKKVLSYLSSEQSKAIHEKMKKLRFDTQIFAGVWPAIQYAADAALTTRSFYQETDQKHLSNQYADALPVGERFEHAEGKTGKVHSDTRIRDYEMAFFPAKKHLNHSTYLWTPDQLKHFYEKKWQFWMTHLSKDNEDGSTNESELIGKRVQVVEKNRAVAKAMENFFGLVAKKYYEKLLAQKAKPADVGPGNDVMYQVIPEAAQEAYSAFQKSISDLPAMSTEPFDPKTAVIPKDQTQSEKFAEALKGIDLDPSPSAVPSPYDFRANLNKPVVDRVALARKAYPILITKKAPGGPSTKGKVDRQDMAIADQSANPSDYIDEKKVLGGREETRRLFFDAMSLLGLTESQFGKLGLDCDTKFVKVNSVNPNSFINHPVIDDVAPRRNPTISKYNGALYTPNGQQELDHQPRQSGKLSQRAKTPMQLECMLTQQSREANLQDQIFHSMLDQKMAAQVINDQALAQNPVLNIQSTNDDEAPAVLDTIVNTYNASATADQKRYRSYYGVMNAVKTAAGNLPNKVQEVCTAQPFGDNEENWRKVFASASSYRNFLKANNKNYEKYDAAIAYRTRTPWKKFTDGLSEVNKYVGYAFLVAMVIGGGAFVLGGAAGLAALSASSLTVAGLFSAAEGTAGAAFLAGGQGMLASIATALGVGGTATGSMAAMMGSLGLKSKFIFMLMNLMFISEIALSGYVDYFELPAQLKYKLGVANSYIGVFSKELIARKDIREFVNEIHAERVALAKQSVITAVLFGLPVVQGVKWAAEFGAPGRAALKRMEAIAGNEAIVGASKSNFASLSDFLANEDKLEAATNEKIQSELEAIRVHKLRVEENGYSFDEAKELEKVTKPYVKQGRMAYLANRAKSLWDYGRFTVLSNDAKVIYINEMQTNSVTQLLTKSKQVEAIYMEYASIQSDVIKSLRAAATKSEEIYVTGGKSFSASARLKDWIKTNFTDVFLQGPTVEIALQQGFEKRLIERAEQGLKGDFSYEVSPSEITVLSEYAYAAQLASHTKELVGPNIHFLKMLAKGGEVTDGQVVYSFFNGKSATEWGQFRTVVKRLGKAKIQGIVPELSDDGYEQLVKTLDDGNHLYKEMEMITKVNEAEAAKAAQASGKAAFVPKVPTTLALPYSGSDVSTATEAAVHAEPTGGSFSMLPKEDDFCSECILNPTEAKSSVEPSAETVIPKSIKPNRINTSGVKPAFKPNTVIAVDVDQSGNVVWDKVEVVDSKPTSILRKFKKTKLIILNLKDLGL